MERIERVVAERAAQPIVDHDRAAVAALPPGPALPARAKNGRALATGTVNRNPGEVRR